MKKKHKKSKAGFSLTEILLVVAILVILASVFAFSVTKYLDVAHGKSIEAEASRQSAIGDIQQSEIHMSALGFGSSATSQVRVVLPSSATPASSAAPA